MTLEELAKEFNDEIKRQEGYNPVGEEWILEEFRKAIKISKEPFNLVKEDMKKGMERIDKIQSLLGLLSSYELTKSEALQLIDIIITRIRK